MKSYIFLIITIIMPFNVQSQNGNAEAAALGVASLAMIAVGGLSMNERLKDLAELKAAEYLLSEGKEGENFCLEVLDLNADESVNYNTGVITYTLIINQKLAGVNYDVRGNTIVSYGGGEKFVVMYINVDKRLNEFGTPLNEDYWLILNFEEWLDLLAEYVIMASWQKDKDTLKEILKDSKISYKGIVPKNGQKIPYHIINENTYIPRDYNDEIKILFNEKSLGIYVKKSKDLVFLGSEYISRIQNFFIKD